MLSVTEEIEDTETLQTTDMQRSSSAVDLTSPHLIINYLIPAILMQIYLIDSVFFLQII